MHESVGNLAAGVPHESSGEIDLPPLFTAAGTLGSFLDQKYTYAPSAVVLLSTYHPPPALLNPGPYELGVVKLFPQPWLPFTAAVQSRDVGVLCYFFLHVVSIFTKEIGEVFRRTYAVWLRLWGSVHPAFVCNDARLDVPVFTPSNHFVEIFKV